MMTKTVRLVAALALLGVVFAAGSWVGSRSADRARSIAGSQAAGSQTALYYACPMHPQYHSDKPGDCPSCGMRLEPVYANGSAAGKAAAADSARLLRLDSARQQLIGVKVGAAELTRSVQGLRTVGRVAADETRVYRIITAVDGWIRETGSVTTGAQVQKDERLGSFYSPEFLGAEQAYVFAASALKNRRKGNETPQQVAVAELGLRQAADTLRNMGMSDIQIAQMSATLATEEKIWIVAPAPGFVMAKNLSPGQRFDKGTEILKIADLSRVWVLADIFGDQADFVKAGATVRVRAPERAREYTGRISAVQPLFDETTRTLKFRIELDNPGFVLKPGMFVDVDFPVSLPEAVTVPSDAVVDGGLRRTVFVDRGNGYFEPRRVETGWHMGDRVQIVKGLMAGERVVVSGSFLLDSESRMKSAASGVSTSETDPVCGMQVERDRATSAGRVVVHDGRAYYFCSEDCRRKFEKQPVAYTK